MIDLVRTIDDFEQQANEILKLPSLLQPLNDEIFDQYRVKVFVKRDDLIHAEISGNKWRKLKYNLKLAIEQGYRHIVTFGGAFSNHIYATAAAGKYFNFETTGIIRGEELNAQSSPTLAFAEACGMKLVFVSRDVYRKLRIENIREYIGNLTTENTLILPEGGTNKFALEGVGEITNELTLQLAITPNYIICPLGSGGTIAGMIEKASENTKILGICVLKNGHYLVKKIEDLLTQTQEISKKKYEILWDFHQGGYAKKTPELMNFIADFQAKHQIPLEPVYSGKMFFAFYQLLKQNYFAPHTSIVLVHTGGIQPS